MKKNFYFKLLVFTSIFCLSVSCGNKQTRSNYEYNYQESEEDEMTPKEKIANAKLEPLEQKILEKEAYFEEELSNVSVKATYPEYQGIFKQKLFYDADDAFEEYEDAINELIRELRAINYDDLADFYRDLIREKRSNYEKVKKQIMYY